MAHLLARQNPLDDVRTTLSSWDNCMAKSYCKWPVIIAIVVGGLIALSVVVCIARCICCGAECVMCCCKCCSCCGSSGSRHRRMKSDPYGAPPPVNPYAPAPFDARPLHQQYRSHAAPAFAAAPAPDRPQFAAFDSPAKPANEDALPAMPSWGDARDRHVAVVDEQPLAPKQGDMELDRLDHPAPYGHTQPSPAPPPSYHTDAYHSDAYHTDAYHTDAYHSDAYHSYSPARQPSPPQQHLPSTYDMPSHDTYVPVRTHTPGYPDHPSPVYDAVSGPPPQPASAYPGQRSYTPQPPTGYPGQKTYQAFNPGQTSEQSSGVQRTWD
ncbi:hypothetical protein BDU57DRAFT_516948 [Ampelomyces quisqualis]|uniref:Uncharacterized protein n=1 Tax=Ampelomyces quisqualis TaxID=50730 RepID=A0A6A5QM68_AMPQU|nr:hypothetical protein BDU57DRAFT_516948 [Ampelomyces quisqualis]